ncbi:MAG: hypothetical protein ACLQPD_24140 [Desulfomonilaceae bacterium]
MRTTSGLEREKIKATLDKEPLAKAIALVTKALQESVITAVDDFWVNTELNVNIKSGKALDKHAAITAYVPLSAGGSGDKCNGKTALPLPEERIGIQVKLDGKSLARATAWVVKILLTTVKAEQEDFWVNIDLNVHMNHGKAKEKRATINVYGDLIDMYNTTIVDTSETNVIPEEILRELCEDLR